MNISYILLYGLAVSGCVSRRDTNFITCEGTITHCELEIEYVKCNDGYSIAGWTCKYTPDQQCKVTAVCYNKY